MSKTQTLVVRAVSVGDLRTLEREAKRWGRASKSRISRATMVKLAIARLAETIEKEESERSTVKLEKSA